MAYGFITVEMPECVVNRLKVINIKGDKRKCTRKAKLNILGMLFFALLSRV